MKRFVFCQLVICMLMVSAAWASDSAYSPRIQKLLREARAAEAKYGKNRPISFKTTEIGQFQGFSDLTKDDRIEIHIPPRIAPDYDDAILAHELMHVILNARGFAGAIDKGEFEPYLAPNARALFGTSYTAAMKQAALYDTIVKLNFCFSDELIDRETAKRGFNPDLVLQKEMERRLQSLSSLHESYENRPDVEKHHQALGEFVFLNRLSRSPKLKASMLRYENISGPKLGPDVEMLRNRLLDTFKGRRCDITKPEDCYRLTLELRGAVSLKGVVLLPKPKTWDPE
jgi:hypothetical protein